MNCMSMRKQLSLQLHTIVEQPLTSVSFGKISCRPIGKDPIHFRWSGPNGREVQLDHSGSEAFGVGPGLYRIFASDANGNEADVQVEVKPLLTDVMVVQEYMCSSASSSTSRDGSVQAVGVNLVGPFLWTTGVQTEFPVLNDVPQGRYTIVPLERKGVVPSFVHMCAAAEVKVKGF